MYPMLHFNGELLVKKVIENAKGKNVSKDAIQLFSGGVDAYTTFLRHIDEKPDLVTVWGGGDININDISGWHNVSAHTKNVAHEYGVDCYFIKSNFVEFLNIRNLDKLVAASGDHWWHGFQHALALLGLSAPVSYRYTTLYIASSYPAYLKGKYTLASDPTIDNHVRFMNLKVKHDGYELDRQDKVRFLVREHKEKGHNIGLRVCWESSGGKNCCRCEKCYRTILEIVSEGGDPNEYGFLWDKNDIQRCKRDLKNKIVTSNDNILFLRAITSHLEEQKKIGQIGSEYDWFFDIDFDHFNSLPIKRIFNCRLMYLVRRIQRKAVAFFTI